MRELTTGQEELEAGEAQAYARALLAAKKAAALPCSRWRAPAPTRIIKDFPQC